MVSLSLPKSHFLRSNIRYPSEWLRTGERIQIKPKYSLTFSGQFGTWPTGGQLLSIRTEKWVNRTYNLFLPKDTFSVFIIGKSIKKMKSWPKNFLPNFIHKCSFFSIFDKRCSYNSFRFIENHFCKFITFLKCIISFPFHFWLHRVCDNHTKFNKKNLE